MKKLLLAFLLIGASVWINRIAAQAALSVSPGDTFVYNGVLDSLTQIYPEVNGYVTNNSGQADTICWKVVSDYVDSNWVGISCCDPSSCYYFTSAGLNNRTNSFPAANGVSNRIYFNSTPNCVADSSKLQLLMWLQHDSAASATMITYKSYFTGVCTTSAIEHVAPSDIKIYPTPVGSQLTVDGLGNLNDARIYVYDMLGNVVLRKTVENAQGEVTLNTTALQAGIYIVGVDSNGQRVATRRIEKFE